MAEAARLESVFASTRNVERTRTIRLGSGVTPLPFDHAFLVAQRFVQLAPSGPPVAGKHGVGILSLGAGAPGGMAATAGQWRIAKEETAKAGRVTDRAE